MRIALLLLTSFLFVGCGDDASQLDGEDSEVKSDGYDESCELNTQTNSSCKSQSMKKALSITPPANWATYAFENMHIPIVSGICNNAGFMKNEVHVRILTFAEKRIGEGEPSTCKYDGTFRVNMPRDFSSLQGYILEYELIATDDANMRYTNGAKTIRRVWIYPSK